MRVDPASRLRLAVKRLMCRLHMAGGMIEFCKDCGKRQPLVWWTTDERWAEFAAGKGVLCPSCFWERALAKGVFLHWMPVTEPERCAITGERPAEEG